VDVRLSLNGRDYSRPGGPGGRAFVFYAEPWLQRLRPDSSPVAGKTAITFIGWFGGLGVWGFGGLGFLVFWGFGVRIFEFRGLAVGDHVIAVCALCTSR
jgi:hypothetical protein